MVSTDTTAVELLDSAGPRAWAVVYVLVVVLVACATRRLARSCLGSQRNRLRDDYEDELRRGGVPVNRLLLPKANRVNWEPSHYAVPG